MERATRGIWLMGAGAALVAAAGLMASNVPVSAGTSSGSLDTTYGTSGLEDLGTSGGVIEGVVGIVAQGDATSVDRSDFRVYLMQQGDTSTSGQTNTEKVVVGRLGADGQPDTGSEWNGDWTHDGRADGIAVDGDDRIYVLGEFRDSDGDAFATVARLLADGQLDTGYGSQGFADVGGGKFAVSPDGEAHIVGTTSKGKLRWAAWRLDSNGDQDTSFGKNGVWTSDFEVLTGTLPPKPKGVRLDSLGNLLIFGTGPQSFSYDDIVVRVLPGGSLDTTFGVAPAATTSASSGRGNGNGNGGGGGGGGGDGGVVTLPSDLISAFDLAVGASDDFYVCGSIELGTNSTDWDPYVMHFDANGLLDTDFGNGTGALAGVAYPGIAGQQLGFRMLVTSSRIVVTGGVVDSTTDHDIQLYAFDLDGDMDTTFGPDGDGISEAGDTGDRDHAYSITVDANGDLLVAGQTDVGPSVSDRYLLFARYCW